MIARGITFLSAGNWPRGAISVQRTASTRRITPEVESIIESSWQEGQRLLGARLFDGPMARLEAWNASPDRLDLSLSPTSYRIFYGTNLTSPRLGQSLDRNVMANPVGVSSIVMTHDGWLLFGRRNSSVAYYPQRVHPFAGSLEEHDLTDVFGAVDRELREELNVSPSDIESIRCLGLVEDACIRQPELIFHTRVYLTRAQIEPQVQAEEHRGSVAIEARRVSIEAALSEHGEFTPVGIAALLLFGRDVYGDEWFRRACLSLPGVT